VRYGLLNYSISNSESPDLREKGAGFQKGDDLRSKEYLVTERLGRLLERMSWSEEEIE